MLSLKNVIPITYAYALSLPTQSDSVLIQVGGSQVRATVVGVGEKVSVLKMPIEVPTIELNSPQEGAAYINDFEVKIG